MSDVTRPCDQGVAASSVGPEFSLFQRVLGHEQKVWSHVSSGQGTAGEYVEAGVEVAGAATAAFFLSKFGTRALSIENTVGKMLVRDETMVGEAHLSKEAAEVGKIGSDSGATVAIQEIKVAPQQNSLLSFASESEKISSLISNNTRYSLIGKMERGTRGAYLIKDEEQVKHIFKLVSSDNVTAQISRSAHAAAAVDSLASRTPTYEEVKYTPGFGSWYVQELLPGKPAAVPSDRLIEQMVGLNSRQAGKAISDSENWTEKVLSQLRDDKFKWQKHVAASGPEGADLVTRVQALIAKNSLTVPRGGDIVHGDFQHYNALVSSNDRLTGYVDWEGAGQGDRAIDLSRMLFDAYVSEAEIGYKANPATLEMLRDKVREISGTVALDQYMGYWILQVADYGNKVGPELFGKFLGVGRRIIYDLNNKSVIAKLAG